jgi:hypothetical protein
MKPSSSQFNSSKDSLVALGNAVSSAKKTNEAAKSDPWVNTGKDVANDYREPMASVKVKKAK